ncbi:MAG: arsenate reductase family protein [Opitutus sp.]|nr:arsenate reductase family protein [Opitutus sp.]
MSALKVYTLATCDSCRRAVKWLRAQGLAVDERAIRETPPTPAELRTMLAAYGGERQKLCNSSGREYRAQEVGRKLPGLSETAFLALLAGNGNLVKRPCVIGDGVALMGFDEAEWSAALKARTAAAAPHAADLR